MKQTNLCPKCNSTDIVIIKALPIQIQKGIIPKLLNPNYHICTKCGYTETWIPSKEELNYIKTHSNFKK